jgi:hypothetical protein
VTTQQLARHALKEHTGEPVHGDVHGVVLEGLQAVELVVQPEGSGRDWTERLMARPRGAHPLAPEVVFQQQGERAIADHVVVVNDSLIVVEHKAAAAGIGVTEGRQPEYAARR